MASSTLPRTELPQPDTAEALRRTFAGYRAVLTTMTPAQLTAELTRINAALEQQRQSVLASTISQPLSEFISKIDQVVLRSPSKATPSPSPRGQAASASPLSPQPSPADLLFGSRGRRLAQRLVVAAARSNARK